MNKAKPNPRTVADAPKDLFGLAVLKGCVEHNDGTFYFASLGGYLHHQRVALERGWVAQPDETQISKQPTDLGRELYERLNLGQFPQKEGARAYTWDWGKIPLPE